jgi:uncharacterized membrane protein
MTVVSSTRPRPWTGEVSGNAAFRCETSRLSRREETTNQRHTRNGEKLARQLGWVSIGLGLAELVAPRKMAEWMGVDTGEQQLLRVCGLRELATGVGILTQRDPSPWMWGRIAGDMMDVACLSAALTLPAANRERLAAATAMVAGVTALDWLCVQQLTDDGGLPSGQEALPVSKSIAVNRSPEEVYRFWRDFQNLSRFMTNIISVRVSSDTHSHWKVKAPGGTTVEWEAEITEDRPHELIAWRTREHSTITHSGWVRFMPGPRGRGTIITVKMQYHPPGGKIGAALATLMGKEPGQQVHEDLRRFKQVMETGEVVRSEGSLRGTGFTEQRPGQPPE